MSFHRVPLFDALTGLDAPFGGFGPILDTSSERIDRLRSVAAEAKARILDLFGVDVSDIPSGAAIQLDQIIQSMWADGWNPSEGDVNLFATDFGAILAIVLFENERGTLVFRSDTDISHVSLWDRNHAVESFPFHKIIKCLSSEDGESIISFVGKTETDPH